MALIPASTGTVWDELRRMREEMDRFFNSMFGGTALAPREVSEWTPAMDVVETANEFIVSAELPGLEKDDIEIEIENNILTIRGEKKEEKREEEGRHYVYERRFGGFSRSFTLPTNVDPDRVTARFENGVLTVTLPKTEEARGRRIEIE